VLAELRQLSRKRWPFPMPAQLGVEQWRQLLDLQDTRSRFDYLDLLAQEEQGEQGRHTLEQILAKDRAMAEPLALTEEVLQAAVGTCEEKRRSLAVFAMQHEAARQAGSWLPWTLGPRELREIASKQSAGQVRRYMDFLESKEEARRREFIKKRASARGGKALLALHEVEKEEKEKEHIYYGLGANVIHLRLNRTTENAFYNWNAYRAFLHSTPLVIDLSFFHKMRNKAHIKSLFYSELRNAMVFNRRALEPYALHFTNVTPEIQQILSDSFTVDCQSTELPVVVTEQDHLDMFDNRRLVYLSPDSKNDLKQVSDDDIYVIGALINKSQDDRGPLTLARAKRLGIRHARFPLKKTLGVQAEMNVDACVGVMCDMKAHNDWFFASRWVPSRHLAPRAKLAVDSSEPWGNRTAMRYQAHRNLLPTTGVSAELAERNQRLTPRRYRELYQRLVMSTSWEQMNQVMKTHKF